MSYYVTFLNIYLVFLSRSAYWRAILI